MDLKMDIKMDKIDKIDIKMDTDRVNFTTSELIDRSYMQLKSIMGKSDKKAFCKPIIINHNRKSYITNFISFCNSINRESEQVKKFFENDMNAITSLMSDNNINEEVSGLKFNSMYKKDLIMNSITNYMKEYVICSLCKSGNTEIKKIDRVNYLKCNNCKGDKAIN